MCEAEVIVNSRFFIINYFSDLDSLESLIFNYLLIMKFKVLFLLFGKFELVDMYVRKRWRRV